MECAQAQEQNAIHDVGLRLDQARPNPNPNPNPVPPTLAFFLVLGSIYHVSATAGRFPYTVWSAAAASSAAGPTELVVPPLQIKTHVCPVAVDAARFCVHRSFFKESTRSWWRPFTAPTGAPRCLRAPNSCSQRRLKPLTSDQHFSFPTAKKRPRPTTNRPV